MRTVVALYDRFDDARQVIQALHDAGFNRDDINLVARDATGHYAEELQQANLRDAATDSGIESASGAATGAGVGAVLGGLGGLLAGLGALAIPGIGPILAAGPVIATLTGAGVGAAAGGIIGALVDMGIPEDHAQLYAEGIRRGGVLVAVRVEDDAAEKAREVMNRYNPVDIENRSAAWRDQQWESFDQNGQPLSEEEMEFNRRDVDTSADMDTGMSQHENEDIYSRERVNDENRVDIPVTGAPDFTRDREDAFTFPVDEDDYALFDQDFRHDYETRYAGSGLAYDEYGTAYQYGYWLASNPQYQEYDWERVEPMAQEEWGRRSLRGAWEDVKDAVQHAWETVKHRI